MSADTVNMPLRAARGALRLGYSAWQQRVLVRELARREVTDVHASQGGGMLWLLLHPLLLFAVYTFLFTIVLKMRIGTKGPDDYTVYLFAGLAPWLITQDALNRGAGVMMANLTIVKKVMVPLEALVAKTLLASFMAQSVLLVLSLLAVVVVRASLPASLVLLLVLLPLHALLMWGLSLLLGSITPYFRDTVELLRVFLTINIFLIPVMYLPDMVPASLRFIVELNPFSHLIWCYQDALYFGGIEHPRSWIVLALMAVLSVLAGSHVFRRLQHHVASVL